MPFLPYAGFCHNLLIHSDNAKELVRITIYLLKEHIIKVVGGQEFVFVWIKLRQAFVFDPFTLFLPLLAYLSFSFFQKIRLTLLTLPGHS